MRSQRFKSEPKAPTADPPQVPETTQGRNPDYGDEHDKLRKRWAKVVRAGRARCWRCGKPLAPTEPWDLGHDDHDRTVYRGPECIPCSRSTATRRADARLRPTEKHPGLL